MTGQYRHCAQLFSCLCSRTQAWNRPQPGCDLPITSVITGYWIRQAIGEIPGDLLGELKKTPRPVQSDDSGGHLAVIRRNRVDYLGLNYYARVMVKPYESRGDNPNCQ
ncbi:MAG: hypothetical protein ACLTW9_02760 [Enterocloster sp.]